MRRRTEVGLTGGFPALLPGAPLSAEVSLALQARLPLQVNLKPGPGFYTERLGPGPVARPGPSKAQDSPGLTDR